MPVLICLRKTLNEDLFYKGSSANLPRLHTCENKVPFWDKSKSFASNISFVLRKNFLTHWMVVEPSNKSKIEWTWERWQWRGTPHSPKFLHYWNLTIRLFSVMLGESLTPLQPLPTGQVIVIIWYSVSPCHLLFIPISYILLASSSSVHADSTDFSDSICLSPSVPIFHRSRQLFQTTSCVRTKLM